MNRVVCLNLHLESCGKKFDVLTFTCIGALMVLKVEEGFEGIESIGETSGSGQGTHCEEARHREAIADAGCTACPNKSSCVAGPNSGNFSISYQALSPKSSGKSNSIPTKIFKFEFCESFIFRVNFIFIAVYTFLKREMNWHGSLSYVVLFNK